MIGKRGKLLVVLYVVFLAVLFLMCSTDLIIREPEKEIYQVAVIIEEERDDNYGNFRKGMCFWGLARQEKVRRKILWLTINRWGSSWLRK